MCRWMAWVGQPVLVEELLFKTQHGIVDQALHARMGAEPTNGDGFGIGWYGTGDGPAGPARSLFASADAESIRRLHPENPRLQRLHPDDRVVVSEPFSDLPGMWREIPQSSAVTVGGGGHFEERRFEPAAARV
jgi:predicted glutamine amidotransferase